MTLIESEPTWSTGLKESLLFLIARWLYNNNNNYRYHKLQSQADFNLFPEKDKIRGRDELDKKH